MDKDMTTRWRQRHAEEMGRYALREAGRRSHVATALGRSISRLSHEVTDECHPVLAQAFEMAHDLATHPETGVRSLLDALEQLVTLSEIESQPRAAFIQRGCWLLDAEDESCHAEDVAAMLSQEAHAASLLKHGSQVMELAAYLRDAQRRGIDLHAEWRAQKCPAQQASRNGARPRRDNGKVTRRGG